MLYHALQGAETYARYAEDARNSGDDELIEFFEECQDEEVDRADRAKELLASRLDTFAEADMTKTKTKTGRREDEEEEDEDPDAEDR